MTTTNKKGKTTVIFTENVTNLQYNRTRINATANWVNNSAITGVNTTNYPIAMIINWTVGVPSDQKASNLSARNKPADITFNPKTDLSDVDSGAAFDI